MLLSNIQSTPFSFKLRKPYDFGAASLQASGVIEVLLSKTQRSDGRGDDVDFFDFITFRKPGAFNVAEQHIKHPIFLQTEET